ncbi:MAG: xylose isomerase [Phycisphaerae bacterium]|nr:xylose isomerase [Phycisphaerae bacterium]
MVKPGSTVQEKFQVLATLGFDGVELDSPNDLDTSEVIEASRSTGIPVHGVVCSEHWKSPLSDPDPEVRARCSRAIEVAINDAKSYGASSVLVVPAVVNQRTSYDQAWQRSTEQLKAILPKAESAGIDIAIENVWNHFLLSPMEAARYVDQFGSKRIGWYMDIGNIVNYGWPQQWVRILGHRIKKVDVKEYSRSRRDDEGLWKGFQVELLEGDCNWPEVMKALDEIGYQGWMTAEIGGGDAQRLKVIADQMDRIIAS